VKRAIILYELDSSDRAPWSPGDDRIANPSYEEFDGTIVENAMIINAGDQVRTCVELMLSDLSWS